MPNPAENRQEPVSMIPVSANVRIEKFSPISGMTISVLPTRT